MSSMRFENVTFQLIDAEKGFLADIANVRWVTEVVDSETENGP